MIIFSLQELLFRLLRDKERLFVEQSILMHQFLNPKTECRVKTNLSIKFMSFCQLTKNSVTSTSERIMFNNSKISVLWLASMIGQ